MRDSSLSGTFVMEFGSVPLEMMRFHVRILVALVCSSVFCHSQLGVCTLPKFVMVLRIVSTQKMNLCVNCHALNFVSV